MEIWLNNMEDALTQTKRSLQQFFAKYPTANDFTKSVARSFPRQSTIQLSPTPWTFGNPYVSWSSKGRNLSYKTALPSDEDVFSNNTKPLWDVLNFNFQLK
jgi:hypothetical protein